jgi:hypothetical protein
LSDNFWDFVIIQSTNGIDKNIGPYGPFLSRLDIAHDSVPLCRIFVPLRRDALQIKRHEPTKVMAIDHIFKILANLGSRGIERGPRWIRRPAELVSVGGDIACASIPMSICLFHFLSFTVPKRTLDINFHTKFLPDTDSCRRPPG